MELRRTGPNGDTLIRRAVERIDALGTRIVSPESAATTELRTFVLFLLGHIAVWTLYAWLSHNNLSGSRDLTST